MNVYSDTCTLSAAAWKGKPKFHNINHRDRKALIQWELNFASLTVFQHVSTEILTETVSMVNIFM